jgi:hypothetical protein
MPELSTIPTLPTEKELAAELQRERRQIEMIKRLGSVENHDADGTSS